LNHPPDEAWIRLFKAHAAASALGAANTVFDGTQVALEVATPGSEAELATALDCFIECANLRLRAFPGQIPDGRSIAPTERARLYGQRV
jgi:hypothetical protein